MPPDTHDDQAQPPELIIAAGEAFGSGAHPSTALALQALQGIAQARPALSPILDIGCGSGILSIAAAKHWPNAHILAADIDAAAAAFVMHNAAMNDVAQQITALRADGPHHPVIEDKAPFSLICCNVIAEHIAGWLPLMQSLLAHGGIMILSGILQEFSASLQDIAHTCRLQIITTLAQGQWRAMILHHDPARIDHTA